METPVAVTKETVRELMKNASSRFSGESPIWRSGYIYALHLLAEDDGDEIKCNHFNEISDLRKYEEMIGPDYDPKADE